MDPGSLRWTLPPSLPGNCDHQADHIRRLPSGWKWVPEVCTCCNMCKRSYNVQRLGFRRPIIEGTQEAIREDRDRDVLPPPCQHRVQPYASWPPLVHRLVKILKINPIFLLIFVSVSQINVRHSFLDTFIGTQEKEDISFSQAYEVNLWVTVTTVVCCMLEIAIYFGYNRMVKFFKKINISHQNFSGTSMAINKHWRTHRDGGYK